MDNWKQSLDRYLTASPYDNEYDSYCENVAAALETMGSPWDDAWQEKLEKFTERLFTKGYNVRGAAAILNRCFTALEHGKFLG
jgi:hypothetical protein